MRIGGVPMRRSSKGGCAGQAGADMRRSCPDPAFPRAKENGRESNLAAVLTGCIRIGTGAGGRRHTSSCFAKEQVERHLPSLPLSSSPLLPQLPCPPSHTSGDSKTKAFSCDAAKRRCRCATPALAPAPYWSSTAIPYIYPCAARSLGRALKLAAAAAAASDALCNRQTRQLGLTSISPSTRLWRRPRHGASPS